jgi:GntR family transcriptional regulator
MWFRINPSLALPIYLQIIRQVEGGVERGTLRPGDRLPAVRELAVSAAVNPNTVARAYRELEERGIVETRRGAGTFIGKGSSTRPEPLQPELDLLLAEAGRMGIGDEELLRLVERRVLGRPRDSEETEQ